MARTGYGPVAPGNIVVPTPNACRPLFTRDGRHDWQAELDHAFTLVDRQSVGSLAAFIAEPVLSAGGIIEPPPGYFAALKQKCAERGTLLFFDEAQTGLCRTGDWYAFQRDGVVPDILTLSTTLGAGLPLSAVITSDEIEQVCHERGFYFGTTHVSDPLAAAVGLTVVTVLAEHAFDRTARLLGDRMRGRLLELRASHEVIGDVRGRGLLQGIELVTDRGTRHPANDVGASVTTECSTWARTSPSSSSPAAASSAWHPRSPSPRTSWTAGWTSSTRRSPPSRAAADPGRRVWLRSGARSW